MNLDSQSPTHVIAALEARVRILEQMVESVHQRLAEQDRLIDELRSTSAQAASLLAAPQWSIAGFPLLTRGDMISFADGKAQAFLASGWWGAKEKIRALNADINAQQATMRRSDAKHEKAMQARYRELATLMQLIEKSDLKMRQLADAHADQAERLEAVYDEYAGLINNLIVSGTPSYLPKAMRLRRRRQILEKYGLFDRDWYIARYPDVLAAQLEPDVHFLQYGLREGRSPNRLIDALRTNGAAASE